MIAKHSDRTLLYVAFLAPLAAFAAGCGGGNSNIVPVEGTITLDDGPLPGALVEFEAQGPEGSPSYGSTDENGHYEMLFSQQQAGAMVGDHIVRIRTYNENEGVDERIPRQYNDASTLQREVVAGETNVFDFDIKTKPQ